ncbi:hypothetical protein DSO57_1032034 [Entomophthora muscae]|uniref:Uncharacterized protein n=1 Tax=Entomophthora muscae TaxID=34485 RepID=A0ACC2UKX8_9FUNG|nr:hypothetical protein DSO57_1032034 [Entomophthora muscae]
MQEFEDRFYLEAQPLIYLKAASLIDVKSALLKADDFEVFMPSGPRAFQKKRHKPSSTDKPKAGESSYTQGTAGTNSTCTCYKCGKPGHMSRECKQSGSTVHHVGAEEYDSEGDQEDEEASQMRRQKTAEQPG